MNKQTKTTEFKWRFYVYFTKLIKKNLNIGSDLVVNIARWHWSTFFPLLLFRGTSMHWLNYNKLVFREQFNRKCFLSRFLVTMIQHFACSRYSQSSSNVTVHPFPPFSSPEKWGWQSWPPRTMLDRVIWQRKTQYSEM